MSSALTQPSIEKYVRTMLGAPVVEVELTTEQITEFTTQALGVYGTWKPVEKLTTFNVIASQQKYTFAENEVGRGIIEYFNPPMFESTVTLDQFDVFKFHSFNLNLDPGDFYAERVWWNEVRRSAGSDDDWEWIPDPTNGGGTLYISPAPSESFPGAYIYVVDPTLTEVPPTDDDFIKEYTLAMAMQVLGRIRRKFANVQGAESSIDMDGSDLVADGKEMQTNLDEYLLNRGQVIGPLRG